MTTLRSYPEYKPSGIDWLGDIPNHWGLRKIKLMGRIKSGEGITSFGIEDEGTFPVYGGNGIRGYSETYTHEGDYLLVGRQGALCGNVHRVSGRFWASEHAIVVTPFSGVNVDWFGSVLQEMDLNQYSISAAQPGLAVERVAQLAAPLPPLSEQGAIAGFLDAMDEKITRFIAARRQMIALLEEQKAAIISQAVTRGLDPDVPLKPSGIDWLGEIPTHWEVRRLKTLLSQPLQYGAIESGDEYDPSLPRYIRITDIANDNTLRDETAKSLTWSAAEPYMLRDGDILFARSGATSGKAFLYRAKWGLAAYAGYLIRARLGPSMSSDFLRLFTHSESYWTSIRSAAIQATIENVSAEKYAGIPVPVPAISEQNAIIDRLASLMSPIEEAKARSQQEMGLMQEYRTRLISDVVTGKLDVRGRADTLRARVPSG